MKPSHIKLLSFLFAFACYFRLAALSDDYEVVRIGKPDNGKLVFSGGDQKFIIKCLASDLGTYSQTSYLGSEEYIEYRHYFSETDFDSTTVEWKDIKKTSWSENSFTLKLKFIFYESNTYDRHLELYSEVTCIDHLGNDLFKKGSKSANQIDQFFQEHLVTNVLIVNSSNGVNVRVEPSVESPLIYRYEEKAKVIVTERSGVYTTVYKAGKYIKTEWLKVYIDDTRSGYIAETFLLPWYEIHPVELDKVFYETQKDTTHKINLELLPNNIVKTLQPINIPYKIDTIDITTPAPAPEENWWNSREMRNTFFLPLDKTGEKLHIHDIPGEYGAHFRSYTGKIDAWNIYLVRQDYPFDPGYLVFSSETGKQLNYNFFGIPMISPSGKYVVDLSNSSDPEETGEPPVCSLNITKRQTNGTMKPIAHNAYAHWLLSGDITSSFWISDHELIIEVVANLESHNFCSLIYSHSQFNNLPSQYLKLTIN